MNTIEIHSKKQLEGMTLAVITDHNNMVCVKAGLKTTKRFATKPSAVARTIQNQILYKKSLKEHSKVQPSSMKRVKGCPKAVKNSTAKKFESDSMLELGDNVPREGTAMKLITFLVEPDSKARADDIITYFMKNFEQKRGGSIVDEGFARGYVTGALRAGHLKVVKK